MSRWVRPLSGLAAVVLGLAGFPGWVVSGDRTRNSFEMLRSAQRLGLDQLTPVRVVWFVMPVLALASLALIIFGRPRPAALLLILVALVVGGVGAVVLASDVEIGAGPMIACGAAVLALPLGGALLRAQDEVETVR